MEIIYGRVQEPKGNVYKTQVDLNRETMEEHREKVLERLRTSCLDVLVIYADREHGANFAYLTGFEPRFEEALLVLHRDGTCYFLLGNENLKMSQYSFIEGNVIHTPHFSLPNQPMVPKKSIGTLVGEAGIRDGMKIGCVGWKLFTSECEENEGLLDIPAFIIDAIRKNNPNGRLCNVCGIFLDPEEGLRTEINANELAHYEFGAGLASSRVLQAMNGILPGKTEMEVAELLAAGGQPITVTTICAAGDRFTNAVVFPRSRRIGMGDRFSLTLGLRGGLSSRAAYVAETREDLPAAVRDYVEKVAIPYYRAAVTWLEMIGIGVSCGDIYRKMEEVLPKEEYHWTLNPGHYTGAEEWTSSPIYSGSTVKLRSGMMLQLDIIPSVPGYGGIGAEDGIAVADRVLREELQRDYPETWKRIVRRRTYMQEHLGIRLQEEILPMSDICGYLRPLLLNQGYALKKQE